MKKICAISLLLLASCSGLWGAHKGSTQEKRKSVAEADDWRVVETDELRKGRVFDRLYPADKGGVPKEIEDAVNDGLRDQESRKDMVEILTDFGNKLDKQNGWSLLPKKKKFSEFWQKGFVGRVAAIKCAKGNKEIKGRAVDLLMHHGVPTGSGSDMKAFFKAADKAFVAQKELAKVQGDLLHSQGELEALGSEHQKVKKNFGACERALNALQDEHQQVQTIFTQLQGQYETLGQEFTASQQANKAWEKNCADWRKGYDALKAQYDVCSKKIGDLNLTVAQLGTENMKLRGQDGARAEAYQEKERELVALQRQKGKREKVVDNSAHLQRIAKLERQNKIAWGAAAVGLTTAALVTLKYWPSSSDKKNRTVKAS